MDPDFWHERWRLNDIGFHKPVVHPYLQTYLNRLQLQEGDTILVPLCGKSLDLLWLREQGLRVIGTELSPTAITDLLRENGLNAERRESPPFTRFRCERLELLCGDHFALESRHLPRIAGAYDRAALVALPPQLRQRYAEHLTRLLPPGARLLLISYDYDQAEADGPPFAVLQAEIERLFAQHFSIEPLDEQDTLDAHRGLQARGITRLLEYTCLLTRKK